MRGTPKFFDTLQFTMDRVNEWFTFLHNEVVSADPNALTHIKLMPNLWTTDVRDHGLDMEFLTRLTGMIGNDAASGGPRLFGERRHWEDHYNFNWVELSMGYDFYKSISPEKIMYNTEGHFLSTGHYRELEQTKEYARINYWLATLHGQTATQTWFWARDEKGAYSRGGKVSTGYAASNNYQPRVVNEVHATIADLNSVSDIVMQFQRQRKPMRIYYTKASSINKSSHMMDVFELYEDLYFEGMPVGFATQDIIKHNDNAEWDAIVIYNTPYAFEGDMAALQSYIDQGGVVIMDEASLLKNEYGESLSSALKSSERGRVLKVADLEQLNEVAAQVAKEAGVSPAILVEEHNATGQDACSWRVLETKSKSRYILNIANMGKGDAEIVISSADGRKIKGLRSVLTGQKYSGAKMTLKKNDLYLLEVEL